MTLRDGVARTVAARVVADRRSEERDDDVARISIDARVAARSVRRARPEPTHTHDDQRYACSSAHRVILSQCRLRVLRTSTCQYDEKLVQLLECLTHSTRHPGDRSVESFLRDRLGAHHCLSSSGLIHASNTMRALTLGLPFHRRAVLHVTEDPTTRTLEKR